jgi:hypothetical protein
MLVGSEQYYDTQKILKNKAQELNAKRETFLNLEESLNNDVKQRQMYEEKR